MACDRGRRHDPALRVQMRKAAVRADPKPTLAIVIEAPDAGCAAVFVCQHQRFEMVGRLIVTGQTTGVGAGPQAAAAIAMQNPDVMVEQAIIRTFRVRVGPELVAIKPKQPGLAAGPQEACAILRECQRNEQTRQVACLRDRMYDRAGQHRPLNTRGGGRCGANEAKQESQGGLTHESYLHVAASGCRTCVK
jgi:hypothetical protein